MYLDLLCLIPFPLCLLPHANTFCPPTELLFIPQYPLSVPSLEAFLSPDGGRLGEGAPSLGPHSLVSPLQWCWLPPRALPHFPAASLLTRRRGAVGVAHPGANLQSPGRIKCDTFETVGVFAAAQWPQAALCP